MDTFDETEISVIDFGDVYEETRQYSAYPIWQDSIYYYGARD